MVRLFTFMLLSAVTVVPLVASQSAKFASSRAEIRASSRGHLVAWAPVTGEVEMTATEAYTSAEKQAIDFLWDHFSPGWFEQAGRLVPASRVESHMREWLQNNLETFPLVRDRSTSVTETTVGKSYQTQFEIQVRGPDAQRFRASGTNAVSRFARQYYNSYLSIAGMLLFVLFLAGRIDRMTRGFLTKRIRFAALLVAIAGAWLLLP